MQEPPRYQRSRAQTQPRRITHYADEFDEEEEDSMDRDIAALEEPDFEKEDELTQQQIEAIERGDPEMLEALEESVY